MPTGLPTAEAQADITAKLTELIQALESHPAWTPPSPNPALFHVWDFVSRSRYIMEELDNIKEGKQVKHPEQIPKNDRARTNEEKAMASFMDVYSRCETINQMIQAPTMMIMLGLSNIEFSADTQNKSNAVCNALRAA